MLYFLSYGFQTAKVTFSLTQGNRAISIPL